MPMQKNYDKCEFPSFIKKKLLMGSVAKVKESFVRFGMVLKRLNKFHCIGSYISTDLNASNTSTINNHNNKKRYNPKLN